MPKLFIFGIGGTGSRVLRSLTMLLASGVKINADKIVPIIIDPDSGNGDLNRTTQYLKQYQSIRRQTLIEGKPEGFFKPEIVTLNQLAHPGRNVAENVRFTLNGVDQKFRNFIGYSTLSMENKAFTELLFSEDNLESSMEVGFKGNPNMGSIVLNQLTRSQEFSDFASNFAQGDRIFIISSIFGGTGAAGFPLLLKNIRNASNINPQPSNHAHLRNAPIGAITLLPYFGVAPDESSTIDKNTFVSKAKAALSYYIENVNPSLNALYYIGDKITQDYENHEGASKQRNKAHFVELAAALSIIDFMNIEDNYLAIDNGKPLRPQYREYGIKEDANPIQFNTLGEMTRNQIRKPLSQFQLFCLYMDKELRNAKNKQPWSNTGTHKLDEGFFQSSFMNELRNFQTGFQEWIQELASNQRSFKPFSSNDAITSRNLFYFIENEPPKRSFMGMGKDNFDLFNHLLNTEAKDKDTSNMAAQPKMMQIFYKATFDIIDMKLNN